uniref:Uncharacterized protein n=1 Tax=Anguilla anguilla TaxID=7936 RepID=A0A0E9XAK4_ANGAN
MSEILKRMQLLECQVMAVEGMSLSPSPLLLIWTMNGHENRHRVGNSEWRA